MLGQDRLGTSCSTAATGSRGGIARHPEGNLWSFGAYPGKPPGQKVSSGAASGGGLIVYLATIRVITKAKVTPFAAATATSDLRIP